MREGDGRQKKPRDWSLTSRIEELNPSLNMLFPPSSSRRQGNWLENSIALGGSRPRFKSQACHLPYQLWDFASINFLTFSGFHRIVMRVKSNTEVQQTFVSPPLLHSIFLLKDPEQVSTSFLPLVMVWPADTDVSLPECNYI